MIFSTALREGDSGYEKIERVDDYLLAHGLKICPMGVIRNALDFRCHCADVKSCEERWQPILEKSFHR